MHEHKWPRARLFQLVDGVIIVDQNHLERKKFKIIKIRLSFLSFFESMHQVGEKMDGTKKLVVKVKNASMHTKTAKAVS